MNQDHYTALLNDDPDATNNTSESINKCLKAYALLEEYQYYVSITKGITITNKR